MQLTAQMKAEIETMRIILRVQHIVSPMISIHKAISLEIKEIFDSSIQESSTYKVRLENLLCETDIKEQDHL